LLEVRKLVKCYENKDVPAVNDISFKVNKNGIIGLIGENGAGKTTFFRLVSGLLEPDSGEVLINNVVVCKYNNPCHMLVSLVFCNEHNLYNKLTAYENIKLFGDLHNIPVKIMKDTIYYFSKILDMEGFLNKKAGTFSTGMKQKTAIVRGLISNPDIILLDEPTAGLDPIAAESIKQFLRTLQEDKIVIFSSHNLADVVEISNRLIVIHKGFLHYDNDITADTMNIDNIKNIYHRIAAS